MTKNQINKRQISISKMSVLIMASFEKKNRVGREEENKLPNHSLTWCNSSSRADYPSTQYNELGRPSVGEYLRLLQPSHDERGGGGGEARCLAGTTPGDTL